MRAKLQVQPGEPSEPEQAAVVVARELLTQLPRQRPVTVGILAFGPHPGLTPTPWVLDGLFEALLEAERTPVNLLTLGDVDTAEAALRKTGRELLVGSGAGELVERPSPDRKISLRMDPRERPLAVPRELLGSSLVLVAPLLAVPPTGARGWSGPLALTTATLARTWGFGKRGTGLSAIGGLRMREGDDEGRAVAVGRELLAAGFAGVSILVDGT
ncbi:MAG: hypothetical protein KC457_25935, partial [Myxococcales bacterium]|nr:hypothetical protein [Myxococcales bacterium]